MGTASLKGQDTWFFRIDPNSIEFTYELKTKVTETFGGKVVQILGVSLDNLTISFESGSGGREYLKAFGNFFKNAMIWQRDTGQPLIFSYPPRGYIVSCYLDSVSIKDDIKNVTFPFTLKAKIQQDLMGTVKTEALSAALNRLVDGVGWSKNEYTYLASNSSIPGDNNNAANGGVAPGRNSGIGNGVGGI